MHSLNTTDSLLWFISNDGFLNYYDGSEYKKIDPMKNISDPLESNYMIRNFNWDNEGNLWLAVHWVKDRVWLIYNDNIEIIKFNKNDDFKTYERWSVKDYDNSTSLIDNLDIEIDLYDKSNKKVYIATKRGFLIFSTE